MHSPTDTVLAALQRRGITPSQSRSRSGQWNAKCPAHPDENGSLSVGTAANGNALMKCHAGCPTDAVLSALGLSTADMFANNRPQTGTVSRPADRRVHPTPKAAAVSYSRGGTVTGIWEYQDERGAVAFCQTRADVEGKGKVYSPFRPVRGGWISGLPDGERPLYNLLAVLEAEHVYVVEGEKCVEALRNSEIVATTSVNGAANPGGTDWSQLARKRVTILPDNDEAGQKYAEKVKAILETLTPRPAVAILNIRGLPHGKDVADVWYGEEGLGLINDSWEPADLQRWLGDQADDAHRDAVRAELRKLRPVLEVKGVSQVLSRKEVNQAARWIEERLKDGPVPSARFMAEALAIGFTERTLKDAKKRAKATSKRDGDGWVWTLQDTGSHK
jgi:hypothetical protein